MAHACSPQCKKVVCIEARAASIVPASACGGSRHRRLAGARIDGPAALADADPEAVAEAAEVPVSRAEDWIDQASA